MSLLLERHPNLDFFVLDIADAVPKDDLASMGHGFVSTKVRKVPHKSALLIEVPKDLCVTAGVPTVRGWVIVSSRY